LSKAGALPSVASYSAPLAGDSAGLTHK
jgi:hypothetical protein